MQAAAADITAPVEPALAAPLVAMAVVACAASLVIATRLVRRLRRGLPVVEPRPHPPATWSGGDVALVALVYVGLLAAAGTIVTASSSLRVQLFADIVTRLVATLAGVGVLRSGGAPRGVCGWVAGRWRDDLRLALGGLGLVLAPLLAIAALLDRVVPYEHPLVSFLQEHRDPVAVALALVAAVVVAPVAEEFFFRRVLQGWLENRLPEADGAAAVGLSAAAFAAAHLGHGLAAAPLFLFGIVLGVVARRTGSLVPCVLLHALFNAVGVGLTLLSPATAGGG